jgi:hypothetical protein
MIAKEFVERVAGCAYLAVYLETASKTARVRLEGPYGGTRGALRLMIEGLAPLCVLPRKMGCMQPGSTDDISHTIIDLFDLPRLQRQRMADY